MGGKKKVLREIYRKLIEVHLMDDVKACQGVSRLLRWRCWWIQVQLARGFCSLFLQTFARNSYKLIRIIMPTLTPLRKHLENYEFHALASAPPSVHTDKQYTDAMGSPSRRSSQLSYSEKMPWRSWPNEVRETARHFPRLSSC